MILDTTFISATKQGLKPRNRKTTHQIKTKKMSKKATTPKAAKPAKKENTKAEAAAAKKHADRMAKIDELLNGKDDGESESEGMEGGKIDSILMLHAKGFTNSEIIEAGFNKSTVYRQVGELKKLQKAPALKYYGHELFEAKVQRIMKAKKLTHQKATEFILGKVSEQDEAEG